MLSRTSTTTANLKFKNEGGDLQQATLNASVNDVMSGEHGTGPASRDGGRLADRSYQEALKNALDAANNNRTFVQATPCVFTFGAD